MSRNVWPGMSGLFASVLRAFAHPTVDTVSVGMSSFGDRSSGTLLAQALIRFAGLRRVEFENSLPECDQTLGGLLPLTSISRIEFAVVPVRGKGLS